MLSHNTLKGMSDDKLIASLKRLVAKQSQLTAELLYHIAEVENRKLHLVHAYGSMFKLCVEGLGLSESMAYKHITVARAVRKHEAILAMVKAGRLHLSAVLVLIPHLTDDSCAELLEAAAGKSKRQVERLIAQRFPKPDVPSQVHKLPEPSPPRARSQDECAQVELPASEQPGASDPVVAATPRCEPGEAATTSPAGSGQPAEQVSQSEGGSTGTGSSHVDGSRQGMRPTSAAAEPAAAAEPPRDQRPRIEPLAAARYKVQFTASEQLVGKLRQAQELLRRQVPDGDPAAICERALDLLIESLMKKRFALPARKAAATQRPKGGDSSPTPPKKASSEPAVASEAASPAQDVTDQCERTATSPSQAGASKRSRYIPASVRRQVAERDGLQCSYIGPDGSRCESQMPASARSAAPSS